MEARDSVEDTVPLFHAHNVCPILVDAPGQIGEGFLHWGVTGRTPTGGGTPVSTGVKGGLLTRRIVSLMMPEGVSKSSSIPIAASLPWSPHDCS